MKSRLSSTIWMLVLTNGVMLFIVLGLGFSAGKKAGDASLFDFAAPSGTTQRSVNVPSPAIWYRGWPSRR